MLCHQVTTNTPCLTSGASSGLSPTPGCSLHPPVMPLPGFRGITPSWSPSLLVTPSELPSPARILYRLLSLKVLIGVFLFSFHVCPQGFGYHPRGGGPRPPPPDWVLCLRATELALPTTSPETLQRHLKGNRSQTKLIFNPTSLPVSPASANDINVPTAQAGSAGSADCNSQVPLGSIQFSPP